MKGLPFRVKELENGDVAIVIRRQAIPATQKVLDAIRFNNSTYDVARTAAIVRLETIKRKVR